MIYPSIPFTAVHPRLDSRSPFSLFRQLYLVQVLDDFTNEPLPIYHIFRQLQSTLLPASNTTVPVGLLTTLPQDNWFTVHFELSTGHSAPCFLFL
ncbi:hypothetical protein AAHC03_04971 [Spirometra sp. Aus1]